MHIGLNGCDWPGEQLTKAEIAHCEQDNCLPWIEDFSAAQMLADKQQKTNWSNAGRQATEDKLVKCWPTGNRRQTALVC